MSSASALGLLWLDVMSSGRAAAARRRRGGWPPRCRTAPAARRSSGRRRAGPRRASPRGARRPSGWAVARAVSSTMARSPSSERGSAMPSAPRADLEPREVPLDPEDAPRSDAHALEHAVAVEQPVIRSRSRSRPQRRRSAHRSMSSCRSPPALALETRATPLGGVACVIHRGVTTIAAQALGGRAQATQPCQATSREHRGRDDGQPVDPLPLLTS